MKIFVTDGSYKHTLAIVRSLGEKSIDVVVGSQSLYALSYHSRHCKERIVYPNPANEKVFIEFILDYLRKNRIDVLLPVGYRVTTIFAQHKNLLSQHTKLAIADWSSMEVAGNKEKTLNLAASININVPQRFYNLEQIKRFPVVVKGINESGFVRYINSAEELSNVDIKNSLVQEYVTGEGYGFFALMNKGKSRAIFMHKRIREYPITGGPSTLAESIYDEELKSIGLKLLENLRWHGIAMVEFKKDTNDGKLKLMEINPKFWGSLDLAIASGIDFPFLLVKMVLGEDIDPISNYLIGLRFQWPFPDDILHVLAKPSSSKYFFKDLFDKNTKKNIWINDIKPNLIQLIITAVEIFSRLKNKTLRYPQGKPKLPL